MFRHSIKQGTRMGALNHSAASSMTGAALNANWKGVQAHDYQHLEVENIGSYPGDYFRQYKVHTCGRVAKPQRKRDENISDSYRKAAGQRRSCDRPVVAANGSSVMHLWSRRRIYSRLVFQSISTAVAGRPGGCRRRNIVAVKTAVSRISGRLSGHSPGAELPQRSSARLAGAMPRVWAEKPVFTMGPDHWGRSSACQGYLWPRTEKRHISDAWTEHHSDANWIAGKNQTSGKTRCISGNRLISLHGDHT